MSASAMKHAGLEQSQLNESNALLNAVPPTSENGLIKNLKQKFRASHEARLVEGDLLRSREPRKIEVSTNSKVRGTSAGFVRKISMNNRRKLAVSSNPFHLSPEDIAHPLNFYMRINDTFKGKKIIKNIKDGLFASSYKGVFLIQKKEEKSWVIILQDGEHLQQHLIEPTEQIIGVVAADDLTVEEIQPKNFVFFLWSSKKIYLCYKNSISPVFTEVEETEEIDAVVGCHSDERSIILIKFKDQLYFKRVDLKTGYEEKIQVGEETRSVIAKEQVLIEVSDGFFEVNLLEGEKLVFEFIMPTDSTVVDAHFSPKNGQLIYIENVDGYSTLKAVRSDMKTSQKLTKWKPWYIEDRSKLCANAFDQCIYIFVNRDSVYELIRFRIDETGFSRMYENDEFLFYPNELFERPVDFPISLRNISVPNFNFFIASLENELCVVTLDVSEFEVIDIPEDVDSGYLAVQDLSSISLHNFSPFLEFRKKNNVAILNVKDDTIILLTRKCLVKIFDLNTFEELSFINENFGLEFKKYIWLLNNFKDEFENFVYRGIFYFIDLSNDLSTVFLAYNSCVVIGTCSKNHLSIFRTRECSVFDRSFACNGDISKFVFSDLHNCIRIYTVDNIEIEVPKNVQNQNFVNVFETRFRFDFCGQTRNNLLIFISFEDFSIKNIFDLNYTIEPLMKEIDQVIYDEGKQIVLFKTEDNFQLCKKEFRLTYIEKRVIEYMLLLHKDIEGQFPAVFILESLNEYMKESYILREYFNPFSILVLQRRPRTYHNLVRRSLEGDLGVSYPQNTLQISPIQLASITLQDSILISILHYLSNTNISFQLDNDDFTVIISNPGEYQASLLHKLVEEVKVYEGSNIQIDNYIKLRSNVIRISQRTPSFNFLSYEFITGHIDQVINQNLERVIFSSTEIPQYSPQFLTSKIQSPHQLYKITKMITTFGILRNNNYWFDVIMENSPIVNVAAQDSRIKVQMISNKINNHKYNADNSLQITEKKMEFARPVKFYKLNANCDLAIGTQDHHNFLEFFLDTDDEELLFSPWRLVIDYKWSTIWKIYLCHSSMHMVFTVLFILMLFFRHNLTLLIINSIILFIFCLYELIGCLMSTKRYLFSYENYIEILGYISGFTAIYWSFVTQDGEEDSEILQIIRVISLIFLFFRFLIHLKIVEYIQAIIIMIFITMYKVIDVVIIVALFVVMLGLVMAVAYYQEAGVGIGNIFWVMNNSVDNLDPSNFPQFIVTLTTAVFLNIIVFNFLLAKISNLFEDIEQLKNKMSLKNKVGILYEYHNVMRFTICLSNLFGFKIDQIEGEGLNKFVKRRNPRYNFFVTTEFEDLNMPGREIDNNIVGAARQGIEEFFDEKNGLSKQMISELKTDIVNEVKNEVMDSIRREFEGSSKRNEHNQNKLLSRGTPRSHGLKSETSCNNLFSMKVTKPEKNETPEFSKEDMIIILRILKERYKSEAKHIEFTPEERKEQVLTVMKDLSIILSKDQIDFLTAFLMI